MARRIGSAWLWVLVSLGCAGDEENGSGSGGGSGGSEGSSGGSSAGSSAEAGPGGTGSAEGGSGSEVSEVGSASGSGDYPPCSDGDLIEVSFAPTTQVDCGAPWADSGLDFLLTNSFHPTCGTDECLAASPDDRGVWLYPSQLAVELQMLSCEATRIEVDVTSYTSSAMILRITDMTGAEIGESTSVEVGVEETVAVDAPQGVPILRFGISGCEGLVHRVRVL